MDWLDGKDLLLLAGASYVAVSSLVRLMRQRHAHVIGDPSTPCP